MRQLREWYIKEPKLGPPLAFLQRFEIAALPPPPPAMDPAAQLAAFQALVDYLSYERHIVDVSCALLDRVIALC